MGQTAALSTTRKAFDEYLPNVFTCSCCRPPPKTQRPWARLSWSTHDLTLALRLHKQIQTIGQVAISLVFHTHPRNLMGIREFFARLNNSRQGGSKSTDPSPTLTADPPVPPRPQSQLAIRLSDSESIPPTLQRRNSDGKLSIQFRSVLTV